MDHKHAAQQVLDCIGGKENIVSAAHCATRLRLVIADNSRVRKNELENAEGAKGVFEAQGQLQIIFGTGTVNKVYDEFIQLAGIEGGTKEEVKQAAAARAPWYQRAIKTLPCWKTASSPVCRLSSPCLTASAPFSWAVCMPSPLLSASTTCTP